MCAIIATNAAVPNLNVVVLAAGLSSRLGQPKALARVHGQSLLRRTLKLASGLRSAGISVVVPPANARFRREARRLSVTWVPNAERRSGLSSSVRCGLRAAQYSSAALLVPVDLAQLKLIELKGLVQRWRARPGQVFATRLGGGERGGERGGAPLILPARFFARARSISGDAGLRALIGSLPAAQRTLVDLPSAHADVDTAQDLASARRRWT
jgi:molybdenum cofactor cytidylyltransferase